MRNDPNKLAHLQETDRHLNQSAEHHGGKEKADPVFGDQRHHHDPHRTGRARDHAGSSAEHRSNQADDERGIETHQRRDAREKRKRHGFGNQCQRHGHAGKNVGLEGTA